MTLKLLRNVLWIEVSVSDDFNLLRANHYFLPDCNVTLTDNYFHFLEQNLN
jgi:hypothetical protein